MNTKFKKATATLAVLSLISGCASLPRPVMEPVVVTKDDLLLRTASDAGNHSSLDIDAGFNPEDLFLLLPVEASDPVPNHYVKSTNLTESGIYDAMVLIARDAGLSVNIEGGPKAAERFGKISAFDVKGQLRDVLEELSQTFGFFYVLKKNSLFLKQEDQFVIELPPALSEDNAAQLTNTLQFLGAKDVYIDRLNRSLVVTANRKALAKIESYMKKIRDTRSLIVYDVNVFQVDLRDNSDTGIQWNKFAYGSVGLDVGTSSASAGGTGTNGVTTTPLFGKHLAATGTGLGLGMVFSSNHFSIDSLISFLRTQGTVKAVSRPKIAVVTGSKGRFRVGRTKTYISKIGTNFSQSLNQTTTETKDLKTGIEVNLGGDISDKTVYTRIAISYSDLVVMDKYTALGTDLSLPDVADRDVETVLRARPGDLMLLGGITIERDSSNDNRGISINASSKEVTRSELVIALSAKVINFKGKGSEPSPDTNPQKGQLISKASEQAPPADAEPKVNANAVFAAELETTRKEVESLKRQLEKAVSETTAARTVPAPSALAAQPRSDANAPQNGGAPAAAASPNASDQKESTDAIARGEVPPPASATPPSVAERRSTADVEPSPAAAVAASAASLQAETEAPKGASRRKIEWIDTYPAANNTSQRPFAITWNPPAQ